MQNVAYYFNSLLLLFFFVVNCLMGRFVASRCYYIIISFGYFINVRMMILAE